MKRKTKFKIKIDTDDSKVVAGFFFNKKTKKDDRKLSEKTVSFEWHSLLSIVVRLYLPILYEECQFLQTFFSSLTWHENEICVVKNPLADKVNWWHCHLGVGKLPENIFLASFCP